MCILSAPRLPLSPNPEKNPLAACIEKTHSCRLRPTLGTLVGMLGGDTHLSASQVLIFTETSRSKKPPKKAKPPAAVALKMLQKTMQWKSSEEKTFFESFLFDDTRVHNHTSLSPLHHTLSLSLSTTPSALHSPVCAIPSHTHAHARNILSLLTHNPVVRVQYPVTAHTQSCRARAHARTRPHSLTHTHDAAQRSPPVMRKRPLNIHQLQLAVPQQHTHTHHNHHRHQLPF